VQALRGLAAVVVILYHLGDREVQDWPDFQWHVFHPFFLFGAVSVDLFFVISGFVITTSCFNDFGRPNRILNFVKKRFYRIYPIYWLTCIPILAWSILHHGKDWFGSLAALFFLPGYINGINPVSWSLVHELVFYTIFALSMFLPFAMLPIILSFVAIGIGVHYFDPEHVLPNWMYSSVLFSLRNLAFLFGVPIAYFARFNRFRFTQVSMVAGLVLLATGAVVNGMGFHDVVHGWPNRVIFFEVASACIIYSAVGQELKGKIWSAKTLHMLGDASYSIYLIHYMVILAAKPFYQYIHGDVLRIAWTVFIFVACMTLGLLTYFYAEEPMLRLFKEKTAAKEKTRAEATPAPLPRTLVGTPGG
jgi:exopolysaccharide production protein ExoZ